MNDMAAGRFRLLPNRLIALLTVSVTTYFVDAGTSNISFIGIRTAQYCSSEKLVLDCGIGDGGNDLPPRIGTTIILVRTALYGRMAAGKCVTTTYPESIGCHADVTSHLEWRCSGRRNCSMLVATFDSIAQPCPRDFKSYLEVSYECVPDCQRTTTLTSTRQPLSQHHQPQKKNPLHSSISSSLRHGYMALYDQPSGVYSQAAGKAHRSCTWTILADHGQHIVVSWRLSSAGSWHSGTTGDSPDRRGMPGQNHGHHGYVAARGTTVHRKTSSSCSVTVAFIDGGGGVDQDSDVNVVGRTSPISSTDAPSRDTVGRYEDDADSTIHVTTCSTGSRDDPRVIYVSKTNRLQIRPTDALMSRLLADNVDDINWKPHLLEYQIIGCADLTPPEGVIVKRHGNEATISCRYGHTGALLSSHRKWNATCRDDQWVGPNGFVITTVDIDNCTAVTPLTNETVEHNKVSASPFNVSSTDLNNSLVLAAVVGIALGAVTGATMMIAMLIIRRSRTTSAIGDDQSEDGARLKNVLRRSDRCRACCGGWFGRHSPGGRHRRESYEYTYACNTTAGVHPHKPRRCPAADRKQGGGELVRTAATSTVADCRFTAEPHLDGDTDLEVADGMAITKFYNECGGCMACATLTRLARLQQQATRHDSNSTEHDWPLARNCQACVTESARKRQLCMNALDGGTIGLEQHHHQQQQQQQQLFATDRGDRCGEVYKAQDKRIQIGNLIACDNRIPATIENDLA